jgi:hypothetical protein
MLLVDTGATQSMLSAEFARAHQLKAGRDASAEHLIDANGRRTIMRRLPTYPSSSRESQAGERSTS